jgi:mRNA interferase RelE/StbE
MYEVRLSHRARRYYDRVSADTARRLNRCFEALVKDPLAGGDIRRVQGTSGVYRFRVGNLRVIYEVDTRQRIVKVSAILPRGEAYKQL